ncbi:hypothetical protein ISX45_10300 [Anoxybacillus caldiproteolyticus]|nr:hypothetical protein ISX45_10300 [Anoxybacillus caldiproteolyticus]
MAIDYKFNTWRVSGEKATVWSQKAYKLVRADVGRISGATIGAILYLHHVKGMTASEIKNSPIAWGVSLPNIKGILKGFNSRANRESIEAYSIFMDMLETEPEMLDRLFDTY